MAEFDDIDINVSVTGATEGAAAMERVAGATRSVGAAADEMDAPVRGVAARIGAWGDRLGQIDEAEREAMRTQRAYTHNIGEMAQSVTAVTGMVQRLAAAVGADGLAGAAGLTTSMASGAAAGAQMGIALGPVGIGLGAVIGGLTPAIQALGEGVDTATISFGNLEANARAAHTRLVEIEETAPEVASALAAIAGILAQSDDFAPSWLGRAAGDGPRSLADVASALGVSDRERRGGGSRRQSNADAGYGAAMTEEGLDAFTSDVSEEEMARRAEADAAYAEESARLAQETIDRLAAEGEAANELFMLKDELRQEELEAEREKQDYLRDLEETAAQGREQQLGDLMGMVGRSSKAMFTAIGQVAVGAKTGEEAFLGMLKSFLEMISEYAALKAATEFADAAASFARYDFGGGAAHVGAGLAFTAVAVATGIGAGAIGAGAPQAPARPSARGEDTGAGGGSVTYVTNWNSPVVTAGTRAELGRELVALQSEAEAA